MADEATQMLARFAAGLQPGDIPDAVRQSCKNLLLDALACAVAGHAGEETGQITAFVDTLAPGDTAGIIGGGRHSLVGATMLNAFLITAITMCDAHRATQAHITPEVVPPALAIAERDDLLGMDLLVAIAAGCEVATRVGLGLDIPTFRGRGFHGPGVIGPFGAAAAVGRLRGFGANKMARSFGLAGSQAAGTFAAWGTPTVKFHQCRGALSGLMAALLAERDFVATKTFLTAPDGGLYTAYSDGGHVDRALDQLGGRWELEQIALRAWPAAAPLQGVITALIDLLGRAELQADAVERVDVDISSFAFALHGGFVTYEGKFEAMLSTHYVVAAVLHDGDLSQAQFAPDRYNAPALKRFVQDRVHVREDRSLSGPATSIRLTLKDGTALTASCAAPLGSPENPMSPAQTEDKFRRYAGPYLAPHQVETVVDSVAQLETLGSVRALMGALRSPADSAR